ncbi:hypothetical protein BCR34DRAFT_52118 [Clohesyomyces aquaticus]|uniref:Uncharacterized protein n=1 Tax=Clohesyomyces aquaticus TaxID=1231657 RepID=A0A1Y2A471_9PLEO|nr:hypothetical protein BCR34DRAFT_52118 [Clohesyomyces aquaticus]
MTWTGSGCVREGEGQAQGVKHAYTPSVTSQTPEPHTLHTSLIFHASLYLAAHTLRIQGLRSLTLYKFTQLLDQYVKSIDVGALMAAVYVLTYGKTEHVLMDAVLEVLERNPEILAREGVWKAVQSWGVGGVGERAWGVGEVPELTRQVCAGAQV